MKKILYLLMFSIFTALSMQAQTAGQPAAPKAEPDELQYYSEPMPQFPGGNDAMKKWIKEHLKYPAEALNKGVSGALFVEVHVRKDGSLTNISLMNTIGSGCDEEALRLAKEMPKWIPGKLKGKTVSVLVRFPVMFELPGHEMRHN